MKVRVKARYGIIGETVVDIQSINDKHDLTKAISSVVTASQAWFNDIEVVNNGYVHIWVYNRADELLEALRSGKEFDATKSDESAFAD